MDYLVQLLSVLPTTLGLTIFGALGALVVSFVAGLLRTSQNGVIRNITRVYVEVFRGTSLLVQLFFLSVALTQLSGYRLYQWTAAILTFALSYGAYGSEVVRGSIAAVPKAQWEATTALSLSSFDRMRRVIIPQAVPLMIPSFGNLLIELMKGTALVSLIAMTDVFKVAQDLRVGDPAAVLGIFGLTLLIYFVLGMLLLRGVHLIERRALANIGRPQPPLFKVRWGFDKPAGAGAGGGVGGDL